MMRIDEKYGSEISQLFSDNNYRKISQVDRGFALPRILKKETILFLGLNPSFTVEAKNGSHYYDLVQSGNYKYFKRFEEIADVIGQKWTHFDLLGIRETKQDLIFNLMKSELGLRFIWENLQISKQIIEESNPRVIVVTNTLARSFLGKDISVTGKNE